MTRLDYPNQQPALDIIRAQARTVAGVARLLGVNYHHTRTALIGETLPTPEILQGLPLLLNRAPEELWTEDVLAAVTEPGGISTAVIRGDDYECVQCGLVDDEDAEHVSYEVDRTNAYAMAPGYDRGRFPMVCTSCDAGPSA